MASALMLALYDNWLNTRGKKFPSFPQSPTKSNKFVKQAIIDAASYVPPPPSEEQKKKIAKM